MVNFANALTALRILLVVPISLALASGALALAFFCYALAILTDLIDGRVARLRGAESPFGAAFDGWADMIFGAFAVWWIWGQDPRLQDLIRVYGVTVLVLALTYFCLARFLTGQFLVLHLWTGKLTGIVMYSALPAVVLLDGAGVWFVHALGIVASLFYVEASAYVLLGRSDPDGRGVFFDRS